MTVLILVDRSNQDFHLNTMVYQDDSIFWPGHILHKMRLCMPPYNEYKDDKVASVKNIFQPVHSVQASVLPVVPACVVWSTNEAGYVQSGDNGRKSYAL